MSRIFVVDDDRDIADLITYALGNLGHEIQVFYDGKSALRAIRKELPDLVLLDVLMPKMNGLDVLRSIRKGKKTRNVHVVLLTAQARAEDHELGRLAGTDFYIDKPFSVAGLVAYVSKVLERKDVEVR